MSEAEAYKKYLSGPYKSAEKGTRAENRDERGCLNADWEPGQLADKSILVVGENGIGDEVLTIACLSDLKNKCKSVSWKCDPKLKELFLRSFPDVHFVSGEDPNPTADGTVYSWELIRRFRKELGHFPWKKDDGNISPYLEPSNSLKECLYDRYRDDTKKVIGLAWRSERDGKPLSDKTCDLRNVTHWSAFFKKLEGEARFVSLQYGNTDDKIAFARWKYGVEIYQDKSIDNFNDVDAAAAQIAVMDYVVSISTATAHLAGALRIPGCVLLSGKPFGHWRAGDNECPWYPTLTPIRQNNPGDWQDVLDTAARGPHVRCV